MDSGIGSVGVGLEMFSFIEQLYPICRSITGDGVRETLDRIGERTPLQVFEVPTGTPVFDWEVPREWNIRDAYIKDPSGKKIIDFKKSNLHVLNYSVPVSGRFGLESIKPHLYTIPEKPDWIPYRTSYYNENWGFCMSHNQLLQLEDGSYEVKIDATLTEGSLTYGEVFIQGRSHEEIIISKRRSRLDRLMPADLVRCSLATGEWQGEVQPSTETPMFLVTLIPWVAAVFVARVNAALAKASWSVGSTEMSATGRSTLTVSSSASVMASAMKSLADSSVTSSLDSFSAVRASAIF